MKSWRKAYLRKLETKAWQNVDFDRHMKEVIYVDDEVADETVPLTTVLNELIWYWELLNDEASILSKEFNSREKKAFKNVAENFIHKAGSKDNISNYYWRFLDEGMNLR
jgi:hypothetical protein